jgi:hypothetical protein
MPPGSRSPAEGSARRQSRHVPSLREDQLIPVGGGRVGRHPNPPELVVFGNGRLMLNIGAVSLLSPKEPVRAIRLFLAEKGSHRYLVVRPSPETADGAIRVHPTGRWYKDRWPAVVLAWANVALRKVGVVERARFVGIHDSKHNWLVFNLDRPQPYRDEEGPDPMRAAVDLWLKSEKRKRTVPLREAFAEIQAVWARAATQEDKPRGPFPFDRPIRVAAYVRKHAKRYARMGVKLGGVGTKPPIVLA